MSQDLTKLWNFLKGKKTYLIAAAGFVYMGGIQQGWWQHNLLVDALLSSGGVASLRHGMTQQNSTPTKTV